MPETSLPDFPNVPGQDSDAVRSLPAASPAPASLFSSARALTAGSLPRGHEEDEEDEDDEDDEDDDDVFVELPQYREFLISRRRRSMGRGRPKRNGVVRQQCTQRKETPVSPGSSNNNSHEVMDARGEEQAEQILSPWSQSMTQLMMKLDQLNLDIEEALSASSSPSDTPSITRKQMSAATVDQTQTEVDAPGNPDEEECRSQFCFSPSSSSCVQHTCKGGGARPKKTKGAVKMSQGGAGPSRTVTYLLWIVEHQLSYTGTVCGVMCAMKTAMAI
ncbi:hypothetical protein MATL_G00049300 [Megalops atlanticus]|uniref:Uncharacterized protein n=1 Tax=Megalops atlanticus TaxID=7932 RepID=A0A9D3QCC2_MEGAT|nr:hypothetical protein MATL_G00049300 [Megalops atlanticus]